MKRKLLKRSYRIPRWLVILLIALFLIITGGMLYFARTAAPFLSRKVKNQVLLSTDSLYHIEFSSLSLNPLTGSISLEEFKLIPDTNVYEKLIHLNRAPENLYDLSVSKVALNRSHLLKLFLKRTVKINSVKLDHPVVHVIHHKLAYHDSAETVQQAMANLISGPLKAIYLDRVALNNITFSYSNKDTSSKDIELQEAQVVLKQLYIDSTTLKDTTRFFYARDCWMSLQNLTFPTADSLYGIKIKDVSYSTRYRKGMVTGFDIKPRYNDADFPKQNKYWKDRFDVSVDTVLFFGLSPVNLLKKKYAIRTVWVNSADLDVFLDRRPPPKPWDKKLPQQMLRESAVQFSVDTLKVKDIDISYRELNPKSGRVGKVTFENTHGYFYNITNDSVKLSKNNFWTADLHTLFMGKGNTTVHFTFDQLSSDNAFSYSGHLGRMDADVLNVATRPLGLVKIKSGVIHQLKFNFSANNYQSKGSVDLHYDRLAVKVLSVDENTGQLKKKGLVSLVANLLMLKNGNMNTENAVKKTSVIYERNPKKSVFSYMWKSLFTGVKEIVGVQEETEDVIKGLKGNKLLKKWRKKK